MLTTKDKLREALRTIDWFAITFPEGLDVLEDRIAQHIGQRDLYANGQSDDAGWGTPEHRCTITTAAGEQCKREAVANGACAIPAHQRAAQKAA